MSALTRFLRKRKEKQAASSEPKSKFYQIANNIAIFGSFIAIALFVLGLFKIIPMTSFMFGITSTIALISIGCLMILPWLRNFEKGRSKKISIVFMCLIAVCTLLWIICVYMGIDLFNKSKTESVSKESLLNTLNFVKITLIISLQFLTLSLIANTIIKYRKNMIVFQAITYLSNLFFDIYVTCFLLCIKISPTKGLEISKSISFLSNKVIVVLFILSIIYMILSSKIMQTIEERRLKFAVEEDYNFDGTKKDNLDEQTEEQTEEQTPEERLEKLKSMLDKNLITQEEFEEKRKEIIKDL